MKTLASCTFTEFMAQAYKTRTAFHALYHAAGIGRMFDAFQKRMQAAETDEERKKLTGGYISDVFWGLMASEPDKLLDVVAACAFLTREEADKLKPTEGLEILLSCISDGDVMRFFINAEQLAPNDTDGILRMLILLHAGVSGAGTSETQSQSNTNGISES